MVSKRPQKVSPAAGLGSTESWLLSKGLPAALAELERVAKTAKDAKPVPMAHRLLLLAKTVLAQHPKRALEVCQYISKVEPEPPIEALVIAGTVQDRLGDRKASAASMRAVVEAERATPLEKLRAANLLVRLSDQALALEAAKRAFDAMGRPLAHAATLLYIAQVTADWELVDQLTTQLRAGYARGELASINESPRTHLLWCDDEALNLQVLDHWSRRNLPDPIRPAPAARPMAGRRLRVGYLSSDLREHPMARLMLGVFRHHDRGRFELFMYCSGWDDGSALRKHVEAQFDHVHSVAALSDEAAADLIRSHQIDVLVELNGPTRANRMGILRHRPAPVQIDYLGLPGSVGGRVVDYIIGDLHTVPPGTERGYPEKVIRLFPSYYPNDHASYVLAPKPARQQVGLPDDPKVRILGMFNAINKVHQAVWDTWMQILRAVPDTVLWMLDPGEVARKAIARAALKAGVPLSRIIASPKLPQAAHLARIQCCDLMLDPWPYGGHTSTVDALYAGVPVLAMEGQNFASRVSTSLLRIAGLETLVCRTPHEYVQRAVSVLEDPAALRALNAYLLSEGRRGPLFRSEAMAWQLEEGYRTAFARALNGLPPDHISLEATAEHPPKKNDRKPRREKAIDTGRRAPVETLTVDGIRYRLQHQIGVGAFTRVYKADDEWGHALAVKVYTPGTPEGLWQNEVRQLRRFAGPGVVYLHRVFAHEGHTYLVLDDAGLPVSRCRFDDVAARVKTAVFIARSVLPVLARLHAAGYCHGDINPQNVLLRLDAGQKLQAASLVDFGLCRTQKQLDAGSAAMARWTPPPEYYRKQTLNGPALDIWHLGVLLLQVITGKTLDYSEADLLADQPLKDAQSLDLPIGTALSAALASDPTRRPDAVGLWRAIVAALNVSSTFTTQKK